MSHCYGRRQALNDVTFSIAPSTFAVLLGNYETNLLAKRLRSRRFSHPLFDHLVGARHSLNEFRRYNLALGAGLSKVSGKLFRIGHLGDLNDLMVFGALAGAEMAMRDVGIDLTLGSGVAAAQAHFRKTIMAKEKEPTEQERFAETHPEGVFNP